jgi:hypothetical protein
MSSRARQASDALTTALIIMASQGLRPNRSDPKFHWMWLSEHPAERQQAAPPVRGLARSTIWRVGRHNSCGTSQLILRR